MTSEELPSPRHQPTRSLSKGKQSVSKNFALTAGEIGVSPANTWAVRMVELVTTISPWYSSEFDEGGVPSKLYRITPFVAAVFSDTVIELVNCPPFGLIVTVGGEHWPKAAL